MPGDQSKEQWRCPVRDCEGGNHRLQQGVTAGQLAAIPARDRAIIEENMAGAFRCGHCGCVYLHESHLDTIVGYLDSPVAGKGWHPVMHPP